MQAFPGTHPFILNMCDVQEGKKNHVGVTEVW